MSERPCKTGFILKQAVIAGLILAAPTWVLAQPVLEDAAVERLREATAYLSGLERFALNTESSIEAVLLSGQKIQYDDASVLIVKRPDKLYAARRGDLVDQEFFYDGKRLTLADGGAGFHATVDAPATIEGMLDFARESLDIVAPAGDFIYTDAFDILMEGVYSGFVVGPAVVQGALCDHLAFSAPGTDWQVWIQQGDRPLPRKVVITSRDVVNAPQFTVIIRDWDLAPDVSDDRFRFGSAESSQAIGFTALGAETP
jgi:hypothetical protein